ncbi:hypothetical protein P3T18_000407 [Paraburkholderia sp. GAS199]|uniref:DUF3331 domain-containing protein n=1 Tax=Paraburkholderia sp. GAS199 TaxID=3035126 RepID=UPI003D20926A
MNHTSEDQLFARALLDLLHPPQIATEQPKIRVPRSSRSMKKLMQMHVEQCSNGNPHPALPAVVLERPTPSTVAVRWSDPRSGYYGEQLWRMSQSRTRAFCAATGALIGPGDIVFKPLARGSTMPFNRDRMILASAIGVYTEDNTH